MKKPVFNSLLWQLLLPVLLLGLFISLVLSFFLTPPLLSSLQANNDRTIAHAATMALNICDDLLNDMLDLRFEENSEMNNASKREALAEIKNLADLFPNIKMIVIDRQGRLQGASFVLENAETKSLLANLQAKKPIREIAVSTFFGHRVFLEHKYFPFWRWHIVSFMTEEDYYQPLLMANRIVRYGNFGTLFAVISSAILLFFLRIYRPLQAIIATTKEVRRGNFNKVNLQEKGEIGQVATAFNNMIGKLEEDRLEIDRILDELKESEEKYRILSENSLTIVIVVKENRIQYVNRAGATFFHLILEEAKGKNVYSLFPQDQTAKLQHRLDALDGGQSAMEMFELRYHQPSGQKRWLEVLASVIPYEGASSILLHALDITRRKRMEQEQQLLREKATRGERMEMLGTLAGGVAHDLNNILGGIVSYPELLLQELDKDDKLHAPLTTIHQSGQRAAAIVQDLLTLTRRGVIVTDIINPGDLIADYLGSAEFESLLHYYPDFSVTSEIGDDLMNIEGSSHHITKSLMNLLTNAAEACPDGGYARITAENRYIDTPFGDYEEVEEGEYVVISVQDNGRGIANGDISRIFEPFYTKKVMGRSGTGLGMSVVWGAVKDHNGYIEVSSEEGRGTTFTLYFPASRAKIPDKDEITEKSIRTGSGERILVVDDIEEQRTIASSMLRRLGYTVEVAESGEAAVKMLERAEYDLLLLDMIMEPGMDGLDTYRTILRHKTSQRAVIASGFSETERVRQTLALGAGSYIKKPYSLETLASAVQDELTINDANRSHS